MKQEKYYWLRWIGLLPLSVFGGVIATFPLHWILFQTLSAGEEPFITPYPEWPEKLIQPFITAFVFIWISFKIAPAFKLKVAILFAIIWIFIAGGGFFLSISNDNDSAFSILNILPILSGVIGSIIALLFIRHNQTIE